MIRWVIYSVLGVAALALVGFLIASSGVVSITARSGHWPITRAILEYSMRRSVAFHSFGTKVPNLDHPGLILKGAGPYAIACSGCHGSPDQPHPRVAQGMTPHPPSLMHTAPTWDAEELFYIIKNGIKFTGMPAWPAPDRDDEIWAVVAFVQKLPTLSAEEYRRLAFAAGDTPAPTVTASPAEEVRDFARIRDVVTESCVRCHGAEGNGRGQPAFPRLAGQREAYLAASLDAFAAGARHSGMMEPVAYALDEPTRHELAEYYAQLPAAPPAGAAGAPAAIERGREIAHRGDPANRLPSCVDCHSSHGERRRPVYPNLAGQPADYLIQQLTLFKNGSRGGTEFSHLMEHIAPRLSGKQVEDVATYFASLPVEHDEHRHSAGAK